MPAPLLVFDLDGTLVDTAHDLIATLNIVLEAEGLPSVEAPKARHLVGAGIRPLLDAALRAREPDVATARVDALYAVYIEHYREHMVDVSRPFPGLEAALARFADAGWRFAVCTNKTQAMAELMLERLELSPRFDAVCGGDHFPVKKPHADHLLGTIAKAGGDPGRAIMIGDSAADIDVARHAGVPSVGVSFGYTPVPVRDLGPTVVIDHYDELWGAVATISRG
jgi:phosphoglycolate phosphatase